MNLTEKSISKLAATAERQHVYDSEHRGFGVRIEPADQGGRRSYFWRVKLNGSAVFKAIGEVGSISLKDARDAARRYAGIAATWKAHGYEDPNPFAKPAKVPSAPRTTVPNFQQLVDAYCLYQVRPHANRPERAECNVLWLVKKYFAAWRDRPVDQITIDDVLHVRNGLAERQKFHQANRCTEFIRALYNWSAKSIDKKVNFWKCENPATDVHRYKESARTRFLQPEELARFNEQLQKETHADLRDFLTLAITTGARRSDIFSIKWSDLDWERKVWLVAHPKNGESYTVSLLPMACATLEHRHREALDSAQFVFPGPGRTHHLTDLKKPWQRFRAVAQIPDTHIHDLRRTVGSYLAINGTNLPTIAEVLGHKNLQSTQVYAKLNEKAAREAREAGQRKMIALMNGAKRRKQKFLTAGTVTS
jgi:integrase